ncbi:hypothetical protein [Fusobacterium nucleatum]|uniref:hypothetical protein n=1 Tax=Fusobacterium nucleatum TaxID=851 RepID=UPI003CC62BB8
MLEIKIKALKNKTWQFEKSGIGGKVELFGVNRFEYKWEDTYTVAVLDPKYNNEHYLHVYRVIINEKEYEFATGEFSNGCWCFYLPKE